MRKSLAIATFIVAGAGAIGVGANFTFNGSDTWGDMEHELISTTNAEGATIPGAPFCVNLNGAAYTLADGGNYSAVTGLTYLGGGSGKGESQMVAGAQVLAPMSKALTTTSCHGVTGTSIEGDAAVLPAVVEAGVSNAAGLVVALDGVSILGSVSTAGSSACNGTATDLSCAGEAGKGLAWNTTVTRPVHGAYTFASWQDVLSVLYFGIINSNFHASDPEGVGAANQNCNSELRAYIANNWSTVFEPNGAGGCTQCTALQHIFRRDDASGTSDVFSAILGAPTGAAYNKAQGSASYGYPPFNYFMGNDSFCNDMSNQHGTTAVVPAGRNTPGIPSGSNNFQTGGVVPNDSQDYDPVRRPCSGTGTTKPTNNPSEQVCEANTFNPNAGVATATVTGGVITSVALVAGKSGSGYAYGPATAPTNCAATDAYSFNALVEDATGTGAVVTACVAAPTATSDGGTISSLFLVSGGSGYTSPTIDLSWYQGTLGLMLPVVTTNTLTADASSANAGYNIQYATVQKTVGSTVATIANFCKANGGGAAIGVLPPSVPNPARPTQNIGGLCPNGDNGNVLQACYVPADLNLNPNCISTASDGAPAIFACSHPSTVGAACTGSTGPDPRTSDPRVYNLYAYTQDAAQANLFTPVVDDSGRPVTGAFYRIHLTQDMLSPNDATTPAGFSVGSIPICNQTDATDQIGCLVQASPCSLGYAGRGGETILANFAGAPGAVGMRLAATGHGGNAGIPDAIQCIQNQEYPFWRKLYLNTVAGFGYGNGGEQTLAACENTAILVNQAVTHENFVPLPDAGVTNNAGAQNDINSGNAFCEDWNEETICSNIAADGGLNGCTAMQAVIPVGAQVKCGNGIVEAYEDCDLGTFGFTGTTLNGNPDGGAANGSPGSSCSNTCRFTK